MTLTASPSYHSPFGLAYYLCMEAEKDQGSSQGSSMPESISPKPTPKGVHSEK